MWVVKLGGSLYDAHELSGWLEVLARCGGRVVIVPGGGPFADAVRSAQSARGFDDAVAHHMALLAMHQYGLMLTGVQPGLEPAERTDALMRLLQYGRVPVWLPSLDQLNRATIPASWAVTSDSLAAWLAGRLGASRLALVKAVNVEGAGMSPQGLAARGIVDPAFPGFVDNAGIPVTVYGRGGHQRFDRALRVAMDGVNQ